MAPSRSRLFLAAGLAAAVLWTAFFAGAGALGLIGPDEPRYTAIARTMAETGDWITPRLNGDVWLEKPVLFYWGAAAAFRLLGEGEAAARLPSALAALTATAAMALVCFRLYGLTTAYALLLIMPTMGLLIGFSRGASTDMLFTGALALALALATRILEGTSARWLAAWGAALGLALLAKGPAAIALAGGAIVLWALLTRRWTDARRLAHPTAVAALIVVAAPWYVLCAWQNPEFLRVFVLEHNILRFLTPVFEHQQPFWFFGVVLLLGLLPWTALLVPVVRDMRTWRPARGTHHPEILAACWALVPLVVFSLSQSKLPGYILPAFPPLAWLMARVAARDADGDSAVLCRTLSAIGVGFVVLTAVAFGPLTYFSEEARAVLVDLHAPAAGPFVAIGVAGAIALLAWRRRAWAALTLTSGLTTTLVLTALTVSVPAMDSRLTAREAGRAAVAAAGSGPLSTYGMERAWRYGLEDYTRRPIDEWQADTAGVLVTTPAGEAELRTQGHTVESLAPVSPSAVVLHVTPALTPTVTR